MALACGGGCAQFALYNNKTQLAPYCDNFDAMFRSGLRDTTEALVHRLREAAQGEVDEGLVTANYG
jgi:putative intracellular protease/amidase